jgi:3-oxoacyl-[acyl-carrier-protein] synthase-3
MAIFSIPNIRIAGISACVPRKVVSNLDYKWVSARERQSIIKITGVEKKRVTEVTTTTSDLCYKAAEKLIDDLRWNKKDIQLLLFVSQTHDYILPATGGILQNRLGLSKDCMALDISLGCSGYVYGLSVICSFIDSSKIRKAMLLAGDTTTMSSYRDKSTYPLFGAAGSATAVEYRQNAPDMAFNLQNDGSGYDAIIIPEGGFRNLPSKKSFIYKKYDKGIYRTGYQLVLKGIDIFNFSLTEVPTNINKLLEYSSRNIDSFDYFVFHQANLLINETIRKKLKIEKEKVPCSLRNFGNTSSASIPLTIVSELGELMQSKNLRLLLSGYGVGLSWGSVILETDKIICPELVEF